MKLSLQDFGTLVVNSATAVQAASAQVMDLRTGSVLRALLEANASIALWMQWLLVRLLRNSRAATSTGGDLDSWMADFGFMRLPPSRARGIVTLSRFDSSGSISVPAGLRVRTTDGTQSFVVVADATSANWSSDAGGFLLAAGSDSIDVPVEAEVPGRAGNVRASTITLIASNVPGIDSASNMLPTTGGADAESDIDYRKRFISFINSRSRATCLAIKDAISSVQQGMSYAVHENIDAASQSSPGHFLIVVDDGSGTPSDTLLDAVRGAVDEVRPLGSRFTVRRPNVLGVNIGVTLQMDQDADRSQVVAAVQDAITTFVNGMVVGATLPVTRVAQLAYAASPSVTNVTSVALNGGMQDIAADQFSVIRLSSLAVMT